MLDPALPRDAEELHALREAAAQWLVDRGIRQWQPGEVDVGTIRAQIEAAEWFVHRRTARVLAALRLGFVERGRREFAAWGPVTLVEKPLTRKTPEVEDLRGSPGTTGTR